MTLKVMIVVLWLMTRCGLVDAYEQSSTRWIGEPKIRSERSSQHKIPMHDWNRTPDLQSV